MWWSLIDDDDDMDDDDDDDDWWEWAKQSTLRLLNVHCLFNEIRCINHS